MTISTKIIRKTNYLYFSYSDKNTHKQRFVCCGMGSKKESKIKALEFELDYLQEQITILSRESKKIRDQIRHLSS